MTKQIFYVSVGAVGQLIMFDMIDCKQKGYRADSGDPEWMSGTVNNKDVMLSMDSGCDVTLVNSRFALPSGFVTGKTLDIH